MGDNGDATSIQNRDSSVISDWFAECFLFMKIKLTALHENNSKTNKKKSVSSAVVEDGSDIEDSKLCFVQWYEILHR